VDSITVNVLHLRIPPLPRFASTARTAFSSFADAHCLPELDSANLTFALGEAIANAIEHAESSEAIDVNFRIDANAVVATVADRGRGFLSPPHGLIPLPGAFAEDGRGFAIMQRCTDFFQVNSEPGHGTVVTLGRYRQKADQGIPTSS
jgi:anti-sigma regulatory factor (Ser/Thr protein kinase)